MTAKFNFVFFFLVELPSYGGKIILLMCDTFIDTYKIFLLTYIISNNFNLSRIVQIRELLVDSSYYLNLIMITCWRYSIVFTCGFFQLIKTS